MHGYFIFANNKFIQKNRSRPFFLCAFKHHFQSNYFLDSKNKMHYTIPQIITPNSQRFIPKSANTSSNLQLGSGSINTNPKHIMSFTLLPL